MITAREARRLMLGKPYTTHEMSAAIKRAAERKESVIYVTNSRVGPDLWAKLEKAGFDLTIRTGGYLEIRW